MTARHKCILPSLCLSFLCLSCLFRPLSMPVAAANPGIRLHRAPTARDALATALTDSQSEIDLSAYAIPTDEIGALFADVLHAHPLLFHVSPDLTYCYDAAGHVVSLYPSYTLEGTALTAARHLYEASLGELVAAIDPAWSEADRALAIHDLLALRYTYDTKENNYDVFRLFCDGTGVCQAYALAYMAVGQAIGLAVDLVYSDAMDHAWNHVRVDGEWFHVDVTRDDPVEGDSPVVRHARLLRSDSGMASLGYTAFTCTGQHTCTSHRFETADGDGVLDAWSSVPRRVGNAWCLIGGDSRLTPVSLSSEATIPAGDHTVKVYPIGDVTGDGVVTPGDLLALRHAEKAGTAAKANLPPYNPFTAPCEAAVLTRLREQILDGLSGMSR